ncbi:MAG: DNA-processing protein DprA [Clostridium sp.]|jgi:DNA processing protein|nr:DNA-processing protein DprA [Clostridium sp.]
MMEERAKPDERAYSYWLNSIPGIGNRRAEQLLEVFGTPKRIYETKEGEYRELLPEELSKRLNEAKKSWDIADEYEKLRKKGISYADKYSPEYPGRLLDIPDAPLGIFYLGKLPTDHILTAAVIGARECSEYGRYVAEELGHFLGKHGVQVISGMARGIDGLSQRAALESGGISFGVLGSGVDVCYPAQNRSLYQKLVETGGVLSTYVPGTLPKPGHFPPRNRIVSGLADALVVIEARQKSGTLITVDMALEQGKEVYAVPGRVTDRLSDGCNKLLKHGAGVFLSPADFLEELERSFSEKLLLKRTTEERVNANTTVNATANANTTNVNNHSNADLNTTHRDLPEKSKQKTISAADDNSDELYKLYHKTMKQLDFNPKSTEQICTGLPKRVDFQTVQNILMQLCFEGKAQIVGNGYFKSVQISHGGMGPGGPVLL